MPCTLIRLEKWCGARRLLRTDGRRRRRVQHAPCDESAGGRDAHVITVTPKDEYRYGYRLWIDDKTAMPLKTQLCDTHGRVIEQMVFAEAGSVMPLLASDAYHRGIWKNRTKRRWGARFD